MVPAAMVNPTRVSHAQTGQDVLVDFLLRRHRIIPKGPEPYEGFYVDLGCAFPVKHSNTYFFYERGWSGLCVDANPDMEAAFRRVRPRDAFVNLGIGGEKATLEFFLFANPELNRFGGSKARVGPREALRSVEVVVDTPAALLHRHVAAGRTIDFMSMDLEGLELAALGGMDWEAHRPRLLLIEAFGAPDKVAASPEATLLRAQDYELVASTGHDAIFLDRARR